MVVFFNYEYGKLIRIIIIIIIPISLERPQGSRSKWQGGGGRLLKGVGRVHELKAGEGALSEISKTWQGFTEERRWGGERGGRLLKRVRFS